LGEKKLKARMKRIIKTEEALVRAVRFIVLDFDLKMNGKNRRIPKYLK
jgi:hypothetical protein